MKKYLLKSFALLAMLFSAITLSAQSGVDWGTIDWIGSTDANYVNKFKCSTTEGLVNIQKPFGDEYGIYMTFPKDVDLTCNLSGFYRQGAGLLLYLSSFTAQETQVVATWNGGSRTFWVYYADGTEGGNEGGATPTEVYDVNFALTSNGSSAEATSGNANEAIDNNAGTRWESEQADPQTWILDLGQLRIFNTLEIVWEGAYGKTFTVSVSDDKETWKPIWTVEGQELAGFPYTQTQKIDKTTARYIQFHGTARGTGYGYSFYEFRVYLAGTSTLTTLEAKAANALAKVGEGNAITLTPKDQNGKPMADVGEVTYTITPADAGTITNGVYTPAKIGLATIVAAIGEVKAAAFEVFAYDGENLALNKSATAGHLNEQAYLSNDNNMGTRWGSNGASHPDNDWWYVDLGNAYDIYAVAIMWETARPANYVLEASETAADDSWLPIKTITDVLPMISPKYEVYVDLTVHPCRYMRVRATSTVGGYDNLAYGISMFDVQVFGTESASLTKTVSASVNDAAMGTATVTQNGEAVTEVTTGSEVTFTAIANEGYTFVNWSDGNTNPSFTTTVDAAMHLTANFRALGTVYCNTPMTVDGHTIYVTMKRSAHETYQLIVRSEENLTNFGGTNFYRSNNIHVKDLRNQGVLSEDKHILTATFSAETAPYMGTPLYVEFEGIGEKTYQQLTNIEYDVECEDDMTVTGLALDPATISIMLGDAQTLKPIFTPAHAFGNELEWSSSDETFVTVDANGVVTAVAEGEAIIKATLVSNPAISATCKITVEPITVKTWWGGFKTFTVNTQEYNVLYSFTRNEDRTITYSVLFDKDASAIGVKEVNVAGVNHGLIYDNVNKTASWTSTTTHSSGEVITGYFYFGIVFDFNFSYIVGSSNERPNPSVESVTLDVTNRELLVNDQLQLTATVNPGYVANKNVVWTSSNTDVATVDANGLVTAVAAGSATITATSAADNTKTATCTIAVVAALTDAIYYANDFFTIKDQSVGFNYAITRTPERKLRYELTVNGEAVVDGTPVAFNIQLNDGDWNSMIDEGSGHFTFESSCTYNDNDPFVGFFYAVYDGGASHVDIYNYTVGSANSPVPTMIAINESDKTANTALTGNIDAVIGRAFTNAYWQTISLPFTLDQEQLKEVFGNGVQVAKLNNSRVASTDNATFELNFEYVSEIEAATPYLIRPSKEVAKGAVVRDVLVDLTLKNVVTTDATMIPVLFKSTFPTAETNYWLAENGYLYGGATAIEAMRAYFTFPKLTAEQASRMRARVVFNENTETSVDNIAIDESAVKVIQNGQLIIIRNGEKYNVQGQKL